MKKARLNKCFLYCCKLHLDFTELMRRSKWVTASQDALGVWTQVVSNRFLFDDCPQRVSFRSRVDPWPCRCCSSNQSTYLSGGVPAVRLAQNPRAEQKSLLRRGNTHPLLLFDESQDDCAIGASDRSHSRKHRRGAFFHWGRRLRWSAAPRLSGVVAEPASHWQGGSGGRWLRRPYPPPPLSYEGGKQPNVLWLHVPHHLFSARSSQPTL